MFVVNKTWAFLFLATPLYPDFINVFCMKLWKKHKCIQWNLQLEAQRWWNFMNTPKHYLTFVTVRKSQYSKILWRKTEQTKSPFFRRVIRCRRSVKAVYSLSFEICRGKDQTQIFRKKSHPFQLISKKNELKINPQPTNRLRKWCSEFFLYEDFTRVK